MAVKKYIPRTLEADILDMSEQFKVLLLTGPRQAGKTTLLRRLCGEKRKYLSLDDILLRETASQDPRLFLQDHPPPVLIDEIQYAPQLLPYIKMHVDETQRTGEFWLTGSQQFQMMRNVSESLAGRVCIIDLLGFSSRESDGRETPGLPFFSEPEHVAAWLESARTLEKPELFEEIWRGWWPDLVTGAVRERARFYEAYVRTYLERDVRDLEQVGDLIVFQQFLTACAARTGQVLNLSALARDTGVTVKTAKRWLSILEASYQVKLVQPWYRNIGKRMVKSPKLYFLDTGLCAYLTLWSDSKTLAAGAMNGAIFETWVFAEILKSWWNRGRNPGLYYYRDKDGKEIDFIFDWNGRLWPMEAKLAANPSREWLRPFKTLERHGVPLGMGAVICMYPDRISLSDNVTALPAGIL